MSFFFFFATPFSCGVLEHDDVWLTPELYIKFTKGVENILSIVASHNLNAS